MKERVTTPNILEIAYLLDRHHRIVEVGTQAGWPYGIEELAVTLEGENIDLDHQSFIRHGSCDLPKLDTAFKAVMSIIHRKEDAGVYDGFYEGPADRDWSAI